MAQPRRHVLLVSLLVGCATPFPRADLVLGQVSTSQQPRAVAGATFSVKVLGDSQLDHELRVGTDGKASVPLCGELMVAGLTVPELEAQLRGCLAPWLRDPAVTVSLLDSGQEVVVLGDLPARVKWEPGLTLARLLLLVGGEGIGSRVGAVEVSRGERRGFVDVGAIGNGEAPDVTLEPGDLVRVECRGCTVRSQPPPARPRSATVTAVLAVAPPKCAAGSAECAPRTDLAAVLVEALPLAGLTEREVRISSSAEGTRLEIAAPTAGEAKARCSALVLASQVALPLQSDPARAWATKELVHTREQLAALGASVRAVPLVGPCADEPSVPALKACVQTRLLTLGAAEPTACESGLLCAIATQWIESRLRVIELSSRYGPEHPTLRAAVAQRDELEAWFERQRKRELTSLTALLARLPKASSAQQARVESALAQLETFDAAEGASEELPQTLRAAALEYGTEALKRTALLSRLLEKHPAIIAIDARLSAIRDAARKLVPLEAEALRNQLGRKPEDPRTREADRQRANLLRVHELLDRLAAPPELTVVQPCR